tara:strand:+ start:123 stop:1085 length:963 start_codon:yes stop_codon:yes gene_type:complete
MEQYYKPYYLTKSTTYLTELNSKLLEKYLELTGNTLSKQTEQKYLNYFKKFQQLLRDYRIFPPNIYNNIDALIHISKEQYELGNLKAETIKQFFQLLRPILNQKNKEINETINIYSKLTANHYKLKTMNELKLLTITYKDLIMLLINEDVKDIDYVLFYILIKYGVRNMDLIINLQEQKDTENYMCVNKLLKKVNQKSEFASLNANDNHKSVRYIRNSYKTFNQYGTKTINIEDPRFVSIIKRLKKENKQYLFGGYNKTNMSNYVHTRFNYYLKTHHRINEGLIYKIVNNYFSSIGEVKNQIALADSRGHDIKTQSTFYE